MALYNNTSGPSGRMVVVQVFEMADSSDGFPSTANWYLLLYPSRGPVGVDDVVGSEEKRISVFLSITVVNRKRQMPTHFSVHKLSSIICAGVGKGALLR